MTLPNTPSQAPQADDSPLGRDIFAAVKYGIYRLRTRLGTRGLVILGAAVIAVGLALNWSWLIAIGVAPLLLTVLPCVAMCALGVCMMPKGEKSSGNQPASDDVHQETTAAPAAKKRSDD
ncbi:MAG TPA: hypothetical protein VE914_24080 [Candidatus Angelobacter sp.]|nr:hypothetical protein [Candidatus Angelobacter sp.]